MRRNRYWTKFLSAAAAFLCDAPQPAVSQTSGSERSVVPSRPVSGYIEDHYEIRPPINSLTIAITSPVSLDGSGFVLLMMLFRRVWINP